jgi:hypothetical protein
MKTLAHRALTCNRHRRSLQQTARNLCVARGSLLLGADMKRKVGGLSSASCSSVRVLDTRTGSALRAGCRSDVAADS